MQDTSPEAPAQRFSFSAVSTQYVHLRILSNHSNNVNNIIRIGEIAFEEVPFEISPIPGITFLLVIATIARLRHYSH